MCTKRLLTSIMLTTLLVGCGSGMAGTYKGDARVMEGRQESDNPGYSLAEVRARIAEDNRTLTLERGGRFILRSGDGTLEGSWRVEGNTVILKDDTSNGNNIVPGLRVEHKLPIRPSGELIRGTSYNYYNLEEFYTKQ